MHFQAFHERIICHLMPMQQFSSTVLLMLEAKDMCLLHDRCLPSGMLTAFHSKHGLVQLQLAQASFLKPLSDSTSKPHCQQLPCCTEQAASPAYSRELMRCQQGCFANLKHTACKKHNRQCCNFSSSLGMSCMFAQNCIDKSRPSMH